MGNCVKSLAEVQKDHISWFPLVKELKTWILWRCLESVETTGLETVYNIYPRCPAKKQNNYREELRKQNYR